MTIRYSTLMLALCALTMAAPAHAHHRQTPPILHYGADGDMTLPRLPSLGRTTTGLLVPSGTDTQVVTIQPYRDPNLLTDVGQVADNQNLAFSWSGTVEAWDTDSDPLGTGQPGRQVVVAKRGTIVQSTQDPTGTSVNPALDVAGQTVAFESLGDLAGQNSAGTRQIFIRQPTGTIVQVSRGVGTSRNPVLSVRKGAIAFESTSDPVTGLDTGVEQIFFGPTDGVTLPTPITNGLAPSTKPVISDDGQIVAFQSQADLANDGKDLGSPQIFIYHPKSKTYAQLTRPPNPATGCTDPGAYRVKQDWRISYVCAGAAYFYMIRTSQRFHIQTPDGDTTRAVTELGIHFMVVSTTADLMAGFGTTPDHQVYQINLFKRPAEPFDTGYAARWFPTRGVPPLFN